MNPQIDALQKEFDLLKAASTIPYEVEQAFRTRLASLVNLSSSAKGATSESQTVQEAGASTYGVLKNPDLYLQITVNGTTYYIPAFT